MTVYNISMKKRSYPQGKVKAIAKAYIKNKFNGAATGMEVYNTTNRNSAKRMMSKALKSPEVKNAIQEELAAVGITREYINKQMYKAIDKNIELGKPSQAVGAQLLIQAQKIYNYLPKDQATKVRETRKVFLDKDFNTVKEELTQSISLTQSLLNDL